MTREEALRWAAQELTHREGAVDARRILDRVWPIHFDAIDEDRFKEFKGMVFARSDGRPMAQILGYRDFWKHRFKVTSDTLDPRPETEHLIETVLEGALPSRILDLGTGTGAIAISLALEFQNADVVATDISPGALSVARENAETLHANNVAFALGDWFEPVSGEFDLIVSNPPYIAEDEFEGLQEDILRFEPKIALSPGWDGLTAYRKIFVQLDAYLSSGGCLVLEHGYKQARSICDLASYHGFDRSDLKQDLSGHDRVSVFKRKTALAVEDPC